MADFISRLKDTAPDEMIALEEAVHNLSRPVFIPDKNPKNVYLEFHCHDSEGNKIEETDEIPAPPSPNALLNLIAGYIYRQLDFYKTCKAVVHTNWTKTTRKGAWRLIMSVGISCKLEYAPIPDEEVYHGSTWTYGTVAHRDAGDVGLPD